MAHIDDIMEESSGRLEAYSWLQGFLLTRNLSGPDGRMLYSYHITKKEYDELQSILQNYCDIYSVNELFKDRKLSIIFILFAAEWWKRKYDGGVWSWDPIYAAFTSEEVSHAIGFNSRKNAIIRALQYWKYDVTRNTGKKYLGAIVANGGIPVKLLHNHERCSPIVRVLKTVLPHAMRSGMNRVELGEYVEKEGRKKLPDALRKSEIYELLADVIWEIVTLSNDYGLQGHKNPMQILNSRKPNWKDQFPLLLEDSSVEKMLTGFIQEVSEIKKTSLSGKIPQAERIISDEDDILKLELEFVFPEHNVDAEYFSKFYNVENKDSLPQTFLINLYDEQDTSIARVSALMGGSGKYKIVKFNKTIDVTQRVVTYLSSPDNKIKAGKIELCDSIDITKPMIFVKREDGNFVYRGSGSVSVKEEECIIVTKDVENSESQDELSFYKEILINGEAYKIYKCCKNCCVGAYNVKLNEQDPTKKYMLKGKLWGYKTYPFNAYIGIPKVCYIDTEGNEQIVNSKNIKYFYYGSTEQIDAISNVSGIVDICCSNGNEKQRIPAIIFSNKADITLKSGKSYKEGSIQLTNFSNFQFILRSSPDYIAEVGENEFFLKSTGFPPENVCLMADNQCGVDIKILLPFPCQGVNIYDEHKNYINNKAISVRHLLGKRIQILDFAEFLKNYNLVLALKSKLDNPISMPLNKRIYLNEKCTELKLIDFEDNIKTLLGYSEKGDDFVHLTIEQNGQVKAKINISKYDTKLIENENSLAMRPDVLSDFSLETLSKTNICAVNICNEDENVTLEQNITENVPTGIWNMDSLNTDAENAYIIFSDPGSEIIIEPTVLYNKDIVDEMEPFLKAVLTENEEEIDAILSNICDDFNSSIWEKINSLSKEFADNYIPINAINFWKKICSHEKAFCTFLLLSNANAKFLKTLKIELLAVSQIILGKTWKEYIKLYNVYVKEKYSYLPSNLIDDIVFRKYEVLVDIFPELEFILAENVFYILTEFTPIAPRLVLSRKTVDELSDDIFRSCETAQDGNNIPKNPVQILQAQNPLDADADDWIFLPFDRLFEESMKNETLLKKYKECGKYIFELERFKDDAMRSVINFPMLCALCTCCGNDSSLINKDIKLKIKEFIDFNEIYFVETYKIASVILSKFENADEE